MHCCCSQRLGSPSDLQAMQQVALFDKKYCNLSADHTPQSQAVTPKNGLSSAIQLLLCMFDQTPTLIPF